MLRFFRVSVSRWVLAVLVLVVILVAAMATTQMVPFVAKTSTQAETPVEEVDKPLLIMYGTVSDAQPVSYMRSREFIAKGKEIKIVFRLWANQEINATIEVARIAGYCVQQDRFGEIRTMRVFGGYPNKIMNHTRWDFRNELSMTLSGSLESVPANLEGRTPMLLEVEIFVEDPRSSANPTFAINWEITVYDTY